MTGTFDAKQFDRFLPADCEKPRYIYVHPKLYKNNKKFWKWFLEYRSKKGE